MSVCPAQERYPVSAENQEALHKLCTEFNGYLGELAEISAGIPPESSLFEYFSLLRVWVSQINIWLGALYRMLVMEAHHGDSGQFSLAAIGVVSEHLVAAKADITKVEELTDKSIALEGDKFLIKHYQRLKSYLIRVKTTLGKIDDELTQLGNKEKQ